MMSSVDYFKENGYAVFPSVVSTDEIDALRNTYEAYLAREEVNTVPPTRFLQLPVFMEAVLADKCVAALRSILGGPFKLLPTFTVRESVYLPWHNDAYFLPPEVKEKDAPLNFIQCTIYLQDNDDEHGGGVTVVPGTHRHPIERAEDGRHDIERHAHNVHNKAGDLVIWDNRITHRSTTARSAPSIRKLAIQWTAAATARHTDAYLEYLRKRATQKMHVSDEVGRRPVAYFADMPNVRFPESFPEPTRTRMADTGVTFVGF